MKISTLLFCFKFTANPILNIKMHGNGAILRTKYGYQGLHLEEGNPKSFIEISQTSIFSFDYGFTLEVVLEADSNALDVIFREQHFSFPAFVDGGLSIGFVRIYSSYKLDFNMTDHDIYLRPDKIHYYVLTYDMATIKVYIDGQQVVTVLGQGPMYEVDDTIYIGGDHDHTHRNFTLYFMRISNRAKTELEILNFAECKYMLSYVA